MDNKKKILIILVIVLSIIVVGLGSFIVYDKFIKNDELKEETNNNGSNDQLTDEDNNNDQLVDRDLEKYLNICGSDDPSVVEACNLMEKYYTYLWDGFMFIESLDVENDKYSEEMLYQFAFENVDEYYLFGSVEYPERCEDINYPGNLDSLKYECYDSNVIYKYEDVLRVKRELFGSSSVLEKKDYDLNGMFVYYYEPWDAFLIFYQDGGGDCGCDQKFVVHDIKHENEILKIYAYYFTLYYPIETDGYMLENIDGERIYTKNNSVEEFLSHKDFFDQYEYTFKKENGKYYMSEVQKIDA